jgi:ribosomal protein L24
MEKINKQSEYSYDEQIYIHYGFYKGKYGRIDGYNEKTNIYIVRIHVTRDDDKEQELLKIETIPTNIRHLKKFLFRKY